MILTLSSVVMAEIEGVLERIYPEEGAGLLLGEIDGETRIVTHALPLENLFQAEERWHRYLIEPKTVLEAEKQAEALGVAIVGVFHSHPDHPPEPSSFDLEWAVPWYIYLITRVVNGKADRSRAWALDNGHSSMTEVQLAIREEAT